ncbi:MAG: hypothetical protein ACI8PP_000805 [Candidatus Pseudothioglobus sp.]|jgi:hypothetical protein
MNLAELGELTDCEYDKAHVCKANKFPQSDRLVHCLTHHDEQADSWQMHGIHYADAEEVAMGEADYVNEITYHTMIEVMYCPFCGMLLSQA